MPCSRGSFDRVATIDRGVSGGGAATGAGAAAAAVAAARREGQVGLAGVERRLARRGADCSSANKPLKPPPEADGLGSVTPCADRQLSNLLNAALNPPIRRSAEPAGRAQRGAGLTGVVNRGAARACSRWRSSAGGLAGGASAGGPSAVATRHAMLAQAVEVGVRAGRMLDELPGRARWLRPGRPMRNRRDAAPLSSSRAGTATPATIIRLGRLFRRLAR